MTSSPEKRPNIDEVAGLMGPRLLIYLDKMRVREDSLAQMCASFRRQAEKQEDPLPAISGATHIEEEVKVVKVDVKDLRRAVDPVSKILDTIHLVLHIDYSSPEIGDPHQRALVHTLARKIMKQKRNPTAIKSEIAKASCICDIEGRSSTTRRLR